MAEQQQLQPGQTEEPAETGFFDRLFSGDKPLWIIVISLAIISLLVVYSSTASMAYKNAGGNTAHYFFNQLKFIAIGFVIMWFVHRINYQRYVRFTVVLFILALGFMLLTFVIGVNLNSASRWIRIPIIGMTFQPSDFMRVTLVALLAQQLAKRQKVIDKIPILPALTPGGWRKNPRKNRDILFDTTIPLLGPVVVACGAIFFSNFSTAALTFFTCWVMLFIGRVRVRELWRLIALVVVVMAAAVTVMYMSTSAVRIRGSTASDWATRSVKRNRCRSRTTRTTCRRSRRRSRSPREVSPARGRVTARSGRTCRTPIPISLTHSLSKSTVWSARV